MFRIDIFEALFNKTTDVSLKVMISLKFLNLDNGVYGAMEQESGLGDSGKKSKKSTHIT
jgi:hypothetical protein